MNEVRFTRHKQCPYCKSMDIEHIDLSDILNNNNKSTPLARANKQVFKCKNCKELFYYTGELMAEQHIQRLEE